MPMLCALRPRFPRPPGLGAGCAGDRLAVGLWPAGGAGLRRRGRNSSSPTPAARAPPGAGGAAVRAQVKADILDTFRKHYLWPELLPPQVDPDAFATPEDLVTALTAKARAAGKDRGWSRLAAGAKGQSYSEEAKEEYGFRLAAMALPGGGKGLRMSYVAQGSPAAQAGLARATSWWPWRRTPRTWIRPPTSWSPTTTGGPWFRCFPTAPEWWPACGCAGCSEAHPGT